MENTLNNDRYLLDLSDIEYIPEVIFKLSSILEDLKVQNKQVYLKLGHVNLNQGQLLSIRSLINGAGAALYCIETESEETKETAISLGIKVSDISNKNLYIEQGKSDTGEAIKSEAIEKTQGENESKSADADYTDELDKIFTASTYHENIFSSETEADSSREEDFIETVEEYSGEDLELEDMPTKYMKQTIRSGQVIEYEGNIVIIGDCHSGSEICAAGDITVWGTLKGIAHAGNLGNKKAKIRALRMNAIQLRIANYYSRRPDSLGDYCINKTDSYTPEEARIVNDEIVVFKIND